MDASATDTFADVAAAAETFERWQADRTYFLRRAEAELERAQHAWHPAAVAAHHQLAEAYLARVHGPFA